MTQATHTIHVQTHGKGLYECTAQVAAWVRAAGIRTGLLTVFCRHTSASLVIQENADPDVRTDMEAAFERLAPEDHRLYVHTIEGPDDMPAHIRSALTGVQLSIPVMDGRPALGTWQGIYVFEHRSVPHARSLALHLIGE
ncbi:MAG: secondary thiamine-phosphate synthase enzyme YjbQ [Bryobacteraceae bacterium]|nr:secondary thiamine-phosphate synthase enzyme YjbQ [Bryobacteraceae bacterium]